MYQPSPRDGAFSSQVGGKLYMWGGDTGDYDKKAGVIKLEMLDPLTEKWIQHALEGHLPTGLSNGATSSVGEYLYGYAFNTVVHLISSYFLVL